MNIQSAEFQHKQKPQQKSSLSLSKGGLPNDWEVRAWSEVLEIRSGRNQKEVENPKGNYPILGSAGKVMGYANKYICEEGTTIIGRKGTINSPMLIQSKFWNVDTAFGLHALENLDKYFLYYFCQSFDFTSLDKGSGRPSLVKSDLLMVKMPVPPLREQKRIVAILDEAFAGISLAVANAEKNLTNARELFDSYLGSLSHKKQPLGDFVDIQTGKLNANAAVEGGRYPFFTCSRDAYEIDTYAFDCEAVLLAGNNASGDFNVKHYDGKFNAYQRTYIISTKPNAKLLYRFLYFQLIKSLKELKENSVGAGTKFLKLGMIKDLKISIPPIEDQERILIIIEQLLSETKHLENIYQQKLKALAELKQSILQKAFAGELS